MYPARKPHKVIGDWEIYVDDEGDQAGQFFYHNRMVKVSQYEKPEELKVVFTDDWDGEGEADGEDEKKDIEAAKEIVVEKDEGKRKKRNLPKPEEDEEPAEELWEGWGKYWDDESSAFYYFNVDTGVSTYDRPESFETMNDPFLGIREEVEVEEIP